MVDLLDKGTDTDALGREWFSARYTLPEGETLTALEVICNGLVIRVDNPTNPQTFNLSKEQSRKLKCGKNVAYLYGYDSDGKRFKFNGQYEFVENPEP